MNLNRVDGRVWKQRQYDVVEILLLQPLHDDASQGKAAAEAAAAGPVADEDSRIAAARRRERGEEALQLLRVREVFVFGAATPPQRAETLEIAGSIGLLPRFAGEIDRFLAGDSAAGDGGSDRVVFHELARD